MFHDLRYCPTVLRCTECKDKIILCWNFHTLLGLLTFLGYRRDGGEAMTMMLRRELSNEIIRIRITCIEYKHVHTRYLSFKLTSRQDAHRMLLERMHCQRLNEQAFGHH